MQFWDKYSETSSKDNLRDHWNCPLVGILRWYHYTWNTTSLGQSLRGIITVYYTFVIPTAATLPLYEVLPVPVPNKPEKTQPRPSTSIPEIKQVHHINNIHVHTPNMRHNMH